MPGRCCGTRHDIYKDRIETKKAWREVCLCLQEDFEAPGDVKKNSLPSIALIYWTQLIDVHKNLSFFILPTTPRFWPHLQDREPTPWLHSPHQNLNGNLILVIIRVINHLHLWIPSLPDETRSRFPQTLSLTHNVPYTSHSCTVPLYYAMLDLKMTL